MIVCVHYYVQSNVCGVEKCPLQFFWSGHPVHSKILGVNIFCTPKKKMKILECAKDALQFFEKS